MVGELLVTAKQRCPVVVPENPGAAGTLPVLPPYCQEITTVSELETAPVPRRNMELLLLLLALAVAMGAYYLVGINSDDGPEPGIHHPGPGPGRDWPWSSTSFCASGQNMPIR